MAQLLINTALGSIGASMSGPLAPIALSLATQAANGTLFGDTRVVEGPRLANLNMLASTEGAPIPRVYGRVRIGGQLIWATRFIETASTVRSGSSGGKSVRSLTSSLGTGSSTDTITYAYAANFAVGLCEGEIAFVRRIWADGKEIDRTTFLHRVHRGAPDQQPDPLIVAKEGAENAPAYRGLAYIVFEAFPLADYGNRIPQLSFEIVKPVHGLCDMVRAVDLIPGSSEYAYSVPALMQSSNGVSVSENRHQLAGASDWTVSLDALQALCPNLKRVALVVSWFGDDMRAGACRIAPRVETRVKPISGQAWTCGGLTRDTAQLVSQIDGKPALGGTPADESVRSALADLRARGLSVLFYPFVMMDVPFDNLLPDPATGAAGQRAFGWRGDISPAARDGTQAAADEIAAFLASDNYRRFILYYAQFCAQAGGVEAFLVGSELRGLTRARGADGGFPAAAKLALLAADVKAVLGASTKVSYAADWSEYGALARNGGAELAFPLDDLWASPAVDFIGIDAYFPIADWRQGDDHRDAQHARSMHDRDALREGVAGGEDFDWYYASDAARDAQQRTPITDGAYGKPWVFRAKDLVNWWSQPHVERSNGVETRQTSWVPQSKPIWFVEVGCPAIDRGANAPNVFPDAKLTTQTLPPFSSGARDDLMQIRALEAIISRFDPRCEGFQEAYNPVAGNGARMVDADHIYIWAYDARPFPAFPSLSSVWSDASSWDHGHWLNGRLEAAPLDRLVCELVSDMAGVSIAPPPLDSIVDGYIIDRPLSARGVIEPLSALFGFDAVVSSGALRFQERRRGEPVRLTQDDLAPLPGGMLVQGSRIDDSRLPHEISLAFTESEWDYRPASVLSRRVPGATRRHSEGEVALMARAGVAQRAADIWLQDLWVARETAEAILRPGLVALEPGDLVLLPVGAGERLYRITRATGLFTRKVTCRAVDLSIHDAPATVGARVSLAPPSLPGPPRVELLDLAIARGDPPALQYLAAFADPWPGPLALYVSSGAGFDFAGAISRSAILGETLDPLHAGPVARFDRANSVRVRMAGGALSSVAEADVLAGRNTLAVRGADGAWEIIGFANAELVGANVWRVSKLLRGQGGEDVLAAREVAAGALVVLLDDSLTPLGAGQGALGLARTYCVGPAALDYADPSYMRVTGAPGPLALRPYAPVRARARRVAGGVEISFIRRGRIDADNWEGVEIPLGESAEAYVVEILSGAVVKRILTCSATSLVYGATEETADFGAPQTNLRLRITQSSASVGRGFALQADVQIL
ncbi:MAG: hypothetical protein JWO64_3623 [Hyphomicrobiales bacterium]|nr:hypothetical protein [Hyphomicrobiales bacterium]